MKIEINHLNKKIKGISVLEDISITLHSGTIYGLMGKNGSGKTMLMRAIAGLILPTSGTIKIDSSELHNDISFPDSMGMLIENPSFLNNYTGFMNLKLIASIKNILSDQDIAKSLEDMGLDPYDKRKYKKYSLGMKQRLGISCAIMENPKLLILDEPTNALDEKGIELLRNLLSDFKEKDTLIIISCHDREELFTIADEVYIMSDGKIGKDA